MKSITSRDNAQYKDLKHLATSSQARKKAGQTLLDGVHLCQAWLELRGQPVECVVCDSSLANEEVRSLADACDRVISLPENLYNGLSQVEHGVGILFVVETPQAAAPHALTENAVLLDGVQDPGNLGSILRSAAAAGVRQVFCGPGTVFCWSPKVLRAAMGAHFVLDIFEHVNLENLVAKSKIPVLATSGYAAQSLYETDLIGQRAWVFGHEGQGVSDALLNGADQRVFVPHLGKVESLNVAACAAVCFFEQMRQNLR